MKNLLIGIVLMFMLAIFSCSVAAQSTIFVNASATGSNNGTSWTNAYTSFQSAFNAAVANDQIWVAKGTYKPSYDYGMGGGSRYFHFRLKNDVSIYGGFAGTETAINQRANYGSGEANETILSGDLNADDDFDIKNGGYQGTTGNDNCYHVFYHPNGLNLTSATVLDGFTISGGNASGADPHSKAGAMYLYSSSPTIQNVVFESNQAGNLGGAVYMYNSTSFFTNISYLNNISAGGGAMYVSYASLVLNNAIFTGNVSSADGGALSTHSSSPTLTNALFSSNTTSNNGGAIIFYSNSVQFDAALSNVTLSNNQAGGSGGAIRFASNNAASALNINNSIVWDNTATTAGNELSLVSAGTTALNYSCYKNQMNDVVVSNGTLTATNNNITSNPLFANPTTFDYRLFPYSPAADAGNNTYNSLSTDIRGEARIQNTTIEMGAYEYTSGVDPDIRILYVDELGVGNSSGTSWANAYTSFQSALDAAVSGDQIWVAKGTYKPSYDYGLGGGPRYYHFRLKNGVSIYGGFSGTETDISQRTSYGAGETNETLLSGDLNGNDIFDVASGGYQGTTGDDNCYHVFYHPSGTNLNNSALINGFIITGGNANGITDYNGGGMSNESSSPTLEQIIVKDNSAATGGGGIYNNDSSPLILNSAFYSNISTNSGGAIDNWNSSNATIINSLFYQNNSSGGGGAILAVNSGLSITNATICNNTALDGGGLYCMWGGSSELNNCIIWGNTASRYGNQTSINSAAITLNYSCYSNSSGDIYNSGGSFTATNNNISSDPKLANTATNDLRLFNNSPAVNTGQNSYNALSTDIRGELRIQDVIIDMGAFEWTNSVDPKIVFVNTIASGSNNGSCWYDAFTSLQSALDIVTSGDQIWVAKGTYKPSYNYGYPGGSRQNHFELQDNLAVYGGFAGTESAIEDRSDFGSGELHETALSGDIGVIGDSTDNCYHVILNWNKGNNSLLDGFTIKQGHASEGMSTSWGGGLYAENVTFTLQNLTFESNYGFLGGGIFLMNSAMTANNLVIKNNYGMSGAGIYCSASSLNLNNASFSKNCATTNGGALSNNGASTIEINNTILWGNQALGKGNEIYIYNGAVSLNYSCYSNNSGDIFNSGGSFNPANCISGNPLFVNSSEGDLRLYGNSPAVNTGLNNCNSLSTDIRGQARIQDTIIDMGAYEWTEGVDPYGFFTLNLRAYLEGPFNGTEMNTGLNTAGFIPLSQPYNASPWYYSGTEAVTAIPNSDVVDWVLIELRDAPDAASAGSAAVVARQAAFLLKDGSISGTDGSSLLTFTGLTLQHSLFAVIRHRNHIAVMSSGGLPLNGATYSWDFTTGAGQAYGSNNAHNEIAPGIWGMTGADGNADQQINNGDKNDVWIQQAGTGGYKAGDFNLDAQVNNGDKNDVWVPNTGLGGQVPE
ncbi:MAG: hypothetical protein JXA03_06270 [Bacteroidales bacterium]|nr:hypothetical protein [Bacteroidales bacterium]